MRLLESRASIRTPTPSEGQEVIVTRPVGVANRLVEEVYEVCIRIFRTDLCSKIVSDENNFIKTT